MAVVSASVAIEPARAVRGPIRVPGDKSIAHRYAMLGALADGRTRIANYLPGADCRSTLACLSALGVEIRIETARRPDGTDALTVTLEGRGLGGLRAPTDVLDAGNSGTTMRLMAGILAGHRFRSTITGDASLRRRPMSRIRDPLELMGARVWLTDDRPPMTIDGGALRGIAYRTPVPSAQVKSAILLAGLHARGETLVTEPEPTRDHSERALRAFGATVSAGPPVGVSGGQRLSGQALTVPGDISSATFWMVAAAGLAGSEVEIVDVGLNPTRTAILDALRRFGADVHVNVEGERAFEPYGRLRVRARGLVPVELGPADVAGLIDELPALAALATLGGELRVTGAAERRVKESDRITCLVNGLRALGADADELADGFHVRGQRRLRGGQADAAGDHRLAMAFTVAALGATGPSTITDAAAVDVSYPGFFDTLHAIAREGR
jgi:3-phosphoshikimate 1-carboxyvinyltransferase